jgi:hypothetical protein
MPRPRLTIKTSVVLTPMDGAGSDDTHNISSTSQNSIPVGPLVEASGEPRGAAWRAATAERNWLVWRPLPNRDPEKPPRKVPQQAGKNAAPVDAATLLFDEAMALIAADPRLGLGYLPREGGALVGLDLDDALDERGRLLPWAKPFFSGETWVETSPSGNSLRILLPRDGWPAMNSAEVSGEPALIANAMKYFTVTLRPFGAPRPVAVAPRLMELMQPVIAGWIAREAERAAEDAKAREAPNGGAWAWFNDLTSEQQQKCAAEMLAALPLATRENYEPWRDLTFSVRAYGHLYGAWDAWSRGSPSYDQFENLKLWEGRERKGGKPRTVGSLIHEAKAAGWDDGPWKVEARKLGLEQLMKRKKVAERMRRIPTDPATLKDLLKGTRT